MQPAVRGFLWHLAGYAVPHVMMAAVLAVIAAARFTAGGESASRSETVILQLFISTAFLACSGAGYACAIGMVARQHAGLRLPSMFGVIAGAVTFTAAATGAVKQLARAWDVSAFMAIAIIGFIVGAAASPLIIIAARTFPKQKEHA